MTTRAAPLAMCPLGASERAVAAEEAKGLTPKLGLELEAFALQTNDSGRLVSYDTLDTMVYGTGSLTDPMRLNYAIWATADALGFRLDMITAQFDAPQF